MATERVNKLLNGTLAGKITKKLFAKQQNQTEVIKADVWNSFLQQVNIDKENGSGTGNTINNEITLENAMNSITKYAVVEAKKQNKSANQVAKEWYNLMGLEIKKAEEKAKETPAEEVPEAPAPVENKEAPELDENCKKAFYREDGTLEYEDEYAEDEKTLLQTTHYWPDGKAIEYVEEYSTETGKVVKSTDYTPEGNLDFVNESNEQGQWLKQTGYRENGTVEYVNEYNPETEKKVSTTHYREDGKTVEYVEEFSQETGNVTKSTDYRTDGSVLFVNDFDDDNKWIRQTGYREDNTVEYVNEYDPEETGTIVFTTHYKEDGKTVDYVD